ncbi:hypothetical protein [Phormidium sp. CCY1219]|uniref:hypothetical protein n=1 Tax=Phormidium sp. CCY1219 TaxID=2886104 RepID=UPI002D1E4C7D|nr:hypothetical protein [Phormidium sp. CCY1219]MEB3830018.1 hypothetical protein [Phormidium sp. CCY1219]
MSEKVLFGFAGVTGEFAGFSPCEESEVNAYLTWVRYGAGDVLAGNWIPMCRLYPHHPRTPLSP